MNTFAFRSLLAAATLALASCGGSDSGGSSGGDTLTVAATAVPHAEILIGVGAWSAGGIDLARRAAPTDHVVPNIVQIGNLLYTRYLFIFEGAGLVLLVAMIGAIGDGVDRSGRAQEIGDDGARIARALLGRYQHRYPALWSA